MKTLQYPDTTVFHWRKRIRQMRWSEFGGADPGPGFVQIKPWLWIAVHTSCLALLTEDLNKLSNISHASLKSYWVKWGGTQGLEPWGWVTEQNKDGANVWRALSLKNIQLRLPKWSETHVRQVWLGTFFSEMLNCLFHEKYI